MKKRKKKCIKCHILLDNNKKCPRPECNTIHTAFYLEHPHYCKECWDKYYGNKKGKLNFEALLNILTK